MVHPLIATQRPQREGEIVSQIGEVFGALHVSLAVARGLDEARSGFNE